MRWRGAREAGAPTLAQLAREEEPELWEEAKERLEEAVKPG